MTLRKLTLSIGLLAALLMLAAPAQAETWFCLLRPAAVPNADPHKLVFVREGDQFVRQPKGQWYDHRIILETEADIHLHTRSGPDHTGIYYILNKKLKTITGAHISHSSVLATKGTCDVY